MKVLLCSELFWPHIGGAEIMMAKFMTAMQERGVQFAVATSHSARDLPDRDSYNGIPVHRFHFHRALTERSLHQIKVVREQVAEFRADFKPDLVHINDISANTFFQMQTAPVHPAPTIVTIHGLPLISEIMENSLFTRTLLSVDCIVAVSKDILFKIPGNPPRNI